MEEIRMTQVLENVKNAWENFKGEKWKAEIDAFLTFSNT
jgi:hypothetical protein